MTSPRRLIQVKGREGREGGRQRVLVFVRGCEVVIVRWYKELLDESLVFLK